MNVDLFQDPLTTPIAPPPSYATSPPPPYSSTNTPTTSPPASLVEVDNGSGVMEVVAETVCITPNYTHHHPPLATANSAVQPGPAVANGPEDGSHPNVGASRSLPSSFSNTDRMESSV